MSLFELSKWKVGQPTLRVVAVLSVLGAASYVMGGCVSPQPRPKRQEADTRSGPYICRDGRPGLRSGIINYKHNDPDAGFNPNTLCLVGNAPLKFTNDDPGKEIIICFRNEDPNASPQDQSPFEDGGTKFEVPRGRTPVDKKTRNDVMDRKVFDFKLSPDGGCDWDAGTNDDGIFREGTAGTLEVGTGGQVPPDAG